MQKGNIVRRVLSCTKTPIGPYFTVESATGNCCEVGLPTSNLKRLYKKESLVRYPVLNISITEDELIHLLYTGILRRALTKQISNKINKFNLEVEESNVNGILHVWVNKEHYWFCCNSVNEFANHIETKIGVKYIPIVKIVVGELIAKL